MPQDKKSAMTKIQELLALILSPGVQSAVGQQTPQYEQLMQTMDARQQTLQPQQTGGMFDIIFRKRRERENALKELGLQ